MGYLPLDKQKQAQIQQLYLSDVYAACRTLQGCSDVLTAGLRAIHQQASAAQQRPHASVRASFADAVKYFSAQHGPTDSMLLRYKESAHRREEGPQSSELSSDVHPMTQYKTAAPNTKTHSGSSLSPPRASGSSQREAPLGVSERRPLVAHSRLFGSHLGAPSPTKKHPDSRSSHPQPSSPVHRQNTGRGSHLTPLSPANRQSGSRSGHPAPLSPVNRQNDSRINHPAALSPVKKQYECQSRPPVGPTPSPATHANYENILETPAAMEPACPRSVRRSVLSWGRASHAVRHSVGGNTSPAEDAFHLKTVSPLAESASRMSPGGSRS